MLEFERIVPVGKKYTSFAEAEQEDREFYATLTPNERLQILLELVRRYQGDPPPRLERVYKVVKREQR